MMNPMLDPNEEARYDAMIVELDNAGYKWNGCLAIAPDGYQFHGLKSNPFYIQVYGVWDYYQWRLRVENNKAG
jgi:hypothetical protein